MIYSLMTVLLVLIMARIQESHNEFLLIDLHKSNAETLKVLTEYMEYTKLVNQLVNCQTLEDKQIVNDKFTVFSQTSIFREEEDV